MITELQELFDKVLEHSRNMTKKCTASDKGDKCLYRGPKGNKCFIGALIPDSLYESAMEYTPIEEILSIIGIDRNLWAHARTLQGIHDDYFDTRELNLSIFANKHKLNYSSPPGHILYTNADENAPDSIKDCNGDIVLALCKICGKAEADLDESCIKTNKYETNAE